MNPETQLEGASTREGRSPNYPYIPLNEAIARAAKLRKGITKNEARIATAGDVWKLGNKSSGLRSIIAALKHFGFIDYIGSGTERKIKLTDAAHRIILDDRPDSPERNALIQKAALLPKAHALLWEKWKAELPPDVEIIAQLTLDEGFSQSGAAELLAEYKKTLEFAKLTGSVNMSDEDSDKVETSSSQTQSGNPKVTPLAPRSSQQAAIEERIVFKPGQEISLRFASEPDAYTYKSLIAYLGFRLKQIEQSDE